MVRFIILIWFFKNYNGLLNELKCSIFNPVGECGYKRDYKRQINRFIH